MNIKIKTALISLSDKSRIVEFARDLADMDVKIMSTGGTARLLEENNIPVTMVSDYTGFPEILDGRVKTLHPKIHGGLLAMRDNPEHMETLQKHGITTIDMVVVNLYPFEKTVAKPDVELADAIENIDIGGPTMLRSSAKNYRGVTTIVDPADYSKVLDEMKAAGGLVSEETRFALAKKVFSHTRDYDSAISSYLDGV